MSAGECQTSNRNEYDDKDDEKNPPALDEGDIQLLKTYVLPAPIHIALKRPKTISRSIRTK